MNQETIEILIKFLPTILVALTIFWAMINGIRRGFRKSLILFIHYSLALGIGIGIFYALSKAIYTMDLHQAYGALGNLIGVDAGGAQTIFDFIEVLVDAKAPEYVNIVSYPEFQQTVYAIGGVAVNLGLGIVCLVVLPILLRTIFYLFYFLFYSQRKHKRHIEERGDKYKKHWFGGFLVGTVKGVISSVICISLISTIYYVAAGGIYRTEKMKEEDRISILDSLGLDSQGLDANKLYDSIKTSRNAGVMKIFDKLKVNEEPIDYFFVDLMLTSTFNTLRVDKNGDKIYANVNLRKELGSIVGTLETILESNAVIVEKVSDGTFKVTVDQEKLDEDLALRMSEVIKGSTILNELVPLNLKGAAKALQKGDIKVDDAIKAYFTDEFIAKIDEINFANEYSKVFQVLFEAIELLPVSSDGQFDFEVFKDQTKLVDYLVNLDTPKVKTFFNNLSEIELITEIAAPIGVSLFASNVKQQGGTGAEIISGLDLSKVNFKAEVANLGNIYESFKEMDLDTNILLSKDKAKIEDYIFNLAQDETNTFKPAAKNFVDDLIGIENPDGSVDGSYLLGQIALLVLQKEAAKFEVTFGEGPDAEKTNLKDILGDNLTNYTTALLREDLHLLIDSCLPALPIVNVIKDNKDNNIIATLKKIDIEALEYAIVGNNNPEVKSGIFDLNLLANGKADKVIQSFMLGFAKNLASKDATTEEIEQLKNEIKAVDNWKNEFRQVCEAAQAIQEIDGIENISFDDKFLESFPQLESQSIDKLSSAVSKTTLISNILIAKFKDVIADMAKVEIDWAKKEIVWLDTFNTEGKIETRGELNVLLNSLNVLTEKDAEGKLILDLNDPFPFIKGLVDTKLPDTKEKYAKSDKLGNSKAVGLLLEVIVKEQLNKNPDIPFELPENIVWNNTYNNDGTIKKRGELAALIEILNLPILQGEDGKISTDNLQDIDKLAQLTADEVADIAKSTILMSNIKGVLKDVTKGTDFEIIVPDNLTADDFAYELVDGKEDYLKGEFGKVINLLNSVRKAVLEDPEKDPTKDKITNEDLLTGVIKLENHDVVVDSIVLYETISNAIIVTSNKPDAMIKIRESAYVKTPEVALTAEDTNKDETAPERKLINKSEITLLLDAAKSLGIKDFTSLNVDDIVAKFTLDNNEIIDNVVKSNILNITVIDNIVQTNEKAEGEKPLAINDTLKAFAKDYDASWYSTYDASGNKTKAGELDNILYGLAAMNTENSGLKFANGTIDIQVNELVKGLNTSVTINSKESTRLKVLYTSDIVSRTITANVKNVKELKVRDVAYVDAKEELPKLKEQELEALVDVINNLDLNLDSVKAHEIINRITINDENNLITNIVNSNILNKTIINNIHSNGNDQIVIPTRLADDEAEAWYGMDGELKHMLESVAAMNVEGSGFKYTEAGVQLDETQLIKGLNNPIVGDKQERNRLDVIYTSDIIATTVTEKINKIDAIDVRDEAYLQQAGLGKKEKLLVDEIRNLVEIINDLDDVKDLNAINATTLINSLNLENEALIHNISDSNILNRTIITNLIKSNTNDALVINAKLSEANDSAWYNTKTTKGELDNMLMALATINHNGFEYDTMHVDINLIVNNLNKQALATNEKLGTNLDVIYTSDVMARTVTKNIKDIDALDIRSIAYADEGTTPKLAKVEIKNLVDVVTDKDLGLANITEIKPYQLVNALKLEDQTLINNIVASNILNKTVVANVITNAGTALTISNTLQNSDSEAWYGDGKELNKMLLGIAAINGNGFTYDENGMKVEPDALVLGLNEKATTTSKESRLDIVYASDVMARTVTKKIEEVNALEIRDEAYEELFTDGKPNKFNVVEIKVLVDTLNATNITQLGAVKAETFINNMTLEDQTLINDIVDSNILNKTVVVNVVKNAGTALTISNTLQNTNSKDWYGKGKELNKMLLGIAAINGNGFTYNNDEISVNANDLVLGLNNNTVLENEITHAKLTRLDVIYDSDVMARTVTTNVTEMNNIEIRPMAIHNEKLDKVEIAKLVDILNKDLALKNIDGISLEKLLSSLEKPNVIDHIVDSNILNKTIIKMINEGNEPGRPLVISDSYKNQVNGDYQDVWYGTNGELTHILTAMNALNITASASGSLNIDPDALVNTIGNNAEVVYKSHIFAATFSNKVIETGLVPEVDVDGNKLVNKVDKVDVLAETEFVNLMKALSAEGTPKLGSSSFNSDSLSGFDISTLPIDVMLKSAIMHKMLSDSIIATNYVTMTYYKDSTNEINVVTVPAKTTIKYVNKAEIKALIGGLSTIGITNISSVSKIDNSYLATVSGNATMTSSITNSAILSNIFSNVITKVKVPNPVPMLPDISLVDAVAKILHTEINTHNVLNADGTPTEILNQSDIKLILDSYNTITK